MPRLQPRWYHHGGLRHTALHSDSKVSQESRSGRIEGAILTHFLVNLLHFGFFTYPALAVQ